MVAAGKTPMRDAEGGENIRLTQSRIVAWKKVVNRVLSEGIIVVFDVFYILYIFHKIKKRVCVYRKKKSMEDGSARV